MRGALGRYVCTLLATGCIEDPTLLLTTRGGTAHPQTPLLTCMPTLLLVHPLAGPTPTPLLAPPSCSCRAQLEAQMKDNARRRIEAPMSDTEKLINAQLLKSVQGLNVRGVSRGNAC